MHIIKKCFILIKVPMHTRLNSHKEYEALQIIVVADKMTTHKLPCNMANKTKNSPIKLQVPGNPKLPNEKIQKRVANKGIKCPKPP